MKTVLHCKKCGHSSDCPFCKKITPEHMKQEKKENHSSKEEKNETPSDEAKEILKKSYK